jgi:hypothetical protein
LPVSKSCRLTTDAKGRWLVQVFHHTNIGKPLHLKSATGKCDTRRYPIKPGIILSTNGNRREQLIQPIGNWREQHIQPIGNW